LTEFLSIAKFYLSVKQKYIGPGRPGLPFGARVNAPMTPNVAADFARHLSSKNYIISDLSLTSGRQSENSTDLSLRKLWELTDLSANDFADEVARFYGLARVGLPELMVCSSAPTDVRIHAISGCGIRPSFTISFPDSP
jgi:hypothetical protein